MPSCLWHSVYHLLTVAALSHSRQVPFATTLWIPLGFILFFASVLCIFLLSCYIFAAADVERHQSYLLSNFLLSIAPDSHRHCWMFPSLFRERLSSAGDLAPTALVCSFLSVCSSRSFSLSESQIPMNTYVFLAAKKKKSNSHLLRRRFSLRSGKVISVVFKFWKTWPVWGGGKGRYRRKPLYFLILGNVFSGCSFIPFTFEKTSFPSTELLFPQDLWRIEIRSEKYLS